MQSARLVRAAAYAWASPNTLLGLAAGLVMVGGGGRLRVTAGVCEFSGGAVGAGCARLPPALRYSAMTLGHVILATSPAALTAARGHEQVHVRQYERWGPFFLPAYAASSLWQVLHGRRGYVDNAFERQAYAGDTGASAGCPARGRSRRSGCRRSRRSADRGRR